MKKLTLIYLLSLMCTMVWAESNFGSTSPQAPRMSVRNEATLQVNANTGRESYAAKAFAARKRTLQATSMTCTEAAAAALSVSNNNVLYNDGETFTVRGYVTRIATAYNANYGNISFWMADTEDGGNVLEAYRCRVNADSIPNVGDIVEVTGNLTKYGSTPEFATSCTCVIIGKASDPTNLGAKTIAEFISLKNVKDTCVLTGIVSNIVNTTYGNFDLVDATGTVYVYGLLTADGQTRQFASMDIAEGDTLTVKAIYNEYNSTPQAKNAIYVSHRKFVNETPAEPITVKLDPASTAEYGWKQVGLWAWVTNETGYTNLFDSWPGYAVTKDAENQWWSYTFEDLPEGELHIIWNNYVLGGYQTSDIDGVASSTCYRLTDETGTYEVVDCPTEEEVVPLNPTIPEISYSDYSKIWPILLDNDTQASWQDKIEYDFRPNDDDRFLYIWDNTYNAASSTGLSFFGTANGYLSFVVGENTDWSGAGFNVTGSSCAAAEALRQEIVADPERYYLHMAIKSTDNYAHAFYLFNNSNSTFVLGDHRIQNGVVLQDFTRNGEWQEIYVPLSLFADAIANADMGTNGNLFVMLSEAVAGAQLNLDAVYICKIGEDIVYDGPTEEDLIAAGYNTENYVLAFKFDVTPCYDVVIAGSYAVDESYAWITDPEQLVHMAPLSGFDGWYVAEIPYGEGYGLSAKPVQLNNLGDFNWDNQSGDYDAWIYRAGNTANINPGYNNEADITYFAAGAYMYEIAYWKNHNDACTQLSGEITIQFKAPQGAPENVEVIGSFDNWTGTAMTYDATTDLWTATVVASSADEFKIREAGTWSNEIMYYNTESGTWWTFGNLKISDYMTDNNIVNVDFSDPASYQWSGNVSPYYPYNLQAESTTGKVVFSWEADAISDLYYINIYQVGEDDAITFLGYLTTNSTSLTYMVHESLDNMEIMWSVQAVTPYSLDEVFAGDNIVMHKSEVELSDFNLTTEDGITLDLTWQSNTADISYLVEIDYYGNGSSGYFLRGDSVTNTEYHFTSTVPGLHYVWITPINAEGERLGGWVEAGTISLDNVPAPFYGLQAEAEEHELHITWEGAADSVYLQIFRMVDGEFTEMIYASATAGHELYYNVDEDGNYGVQLRPWVEYRTGEYGWLGGYFTNIAVQSFTVPTYTIQIDATEGGRVWPDGISGNYPEGYVLNVYAYPYDGYRFARWSDNSTENPLTIVVSGDLTITAIFEEEEDMPDAIEDVTDESTTQKVFMNGNIYIIRNGKIYTIQGQPVK